MSLDQHLHGKTSPAIVGHHTTTDALYGFDVPPYAFRDLIARLNLASASDLDVESASRRKPQHTNEILEYFGFPDGATRAKILSSFDGNYQYGAEIVRATYHVVRHFGLSGSYESTPSKTQDIFLAVAKLIHQNDVGIASFLINRLGLMHIPEMVDKINGYALLQIGSQTSLVPKGHLGRITKKRDVWTLSSPRGPRLMYELGFEPQDLDGVTMYAHRRTNGSGSYIH